MKQRRVKIGGTGTVFITGKRFSPGWDDLNVVVAKLWKLGILEDLVPEIKLSVILAHRGPMYRTVPSILERADVKNYKKKVPFEIMAMLWVIACFNYKWCRGPDPCTVKRYKHPKRRVTREYDCPFCRQIVLEPNKRFKSREVLITQYANALHRHSKKCNELLYLNRRVI